VGSDELKAFFCVSRAKPSGRPYAKEYTDTQKGDRHDYMSNLALGERPRQSSSAESFIHQFNESDYPKKEQ